MPNSLKICKTKFVYCTFLPVSPEHAIHSGIPIVVYVMRLSHCNFRSFTVAITSFSVYLLQYTLIRYLFNPIYLLHSPIAQHFERFKSFFLMRPMSLLHITLSVIRTFLLYFVRTLAFVFSHDKICRLSQIVFHAVAILFL